MEGSSSNSSNDSNYEDAIDIEAPSGHPNESSMMELEDVELVDTSDEEDGNEDDEENVGKETEDSSHSSDPTPIHTHTAASWIEYLYRSYGYFTLFMASGGGMLTAIVAFLCPSDNKQIDEDDLMAVTSLANGDKAFLFVGSDGGSSFISYV
jgi:hypothetical protein